MLLDDRPLVPAAMPGQVKTSVALGAKGYLRPALEAAEQRSCDAVVVVSAVDLFNRHYLLTAAGTRGAGTL